MSKEAEARALYNTLCHTLDSMNWRYDKPDELAIHTIARGVNMPIKLVIRIDADNQVMYLKSPMPFAIPASLRDVLGKAVNIANFSMLNGSFEYDYSDGYLAFRMVVPYMDSIISEAVCKYMIILSCSMTDRFNDKFKALAEGRMTLNEFETL